MTKRNYQVFISKSPAHQNTKTLKNNLFLLLLFLLLLLLLVHHQRNETWHNITRCSICIHLHTQHEDSRTLAPPLTQVFFFCHSTPTHSPPPALTTPSQVQRGEVRPCHATQHTGGSNPCPEEECRVWGAREGRQRPWVREGV